MVTLVAALEGDVQCSMETSSVVMTLLREPADPQLRAKAEALFVRLQGVRRSSFLLSPVYPCDFPIPEHGELQSPCVLYICPALTSVTYACEHSGIADGIHGSMSSGTLCACVSSCAVCSASSEL